jgi:hypothetical protein
LKQFGPHVLDPIFYLFPVAAIVSGGHHSLLEVALALSLNDVVDYHIGFYATLIPKRKGAKHAGIAEIEKTLVAAEKHADNRRLLVFYPDGKSKVAPAGAYLFLPSEKQFFDFADGLERLKEFKKFPEWPAKKELFKYLTEKKMF